MAEKEMTGIRSLVPSGWHRTESIGRFVDKGIAGELKMQDVDSVEYEGATGIPLLLTEIGLDVNQKSKQMRVLTKMSSILERGGVCVPSCIVLYTPSNKPNPYINANIIVSGLKKQIEEINCVGGVPDIESFRVRCPYFWGDSDWHILSPEEYTNFIVTSRNNSNEASCLMNLPQQR